MLSAAQGLLLCAKHLSGAATAGEAHGEVDDDDIELLLLLALAA